MSILFMLTKNNSSYQYVIGKHMHPSHKLHFTAVLQPQLVLSFSDNFQTLFLSNRSYMEKMVYNAIFHPFHKLVLVLFYLMFY